MDKRYYALYNHWCMDSQSHSIKGRGTMHSVTGTWFLNLTPSKVEVLCILWLVHGFSNLTPSKVEVLCILWLVHGFSNLTPSKVEVLWTLQRLVVVHGFSISPITTGRGTLDSTTTGSVTWILNLTFTIGAVLSLGTTSHGHLLEMRWTTLSQTFS